MTQKPVINYSLQLPIEIAPIPMCACHFTPNELTGSMLFAICQMEMSIFFNPCIDYDDKEISICEAKKIGDECALIWKENEYLQPLFRKAYLGTNILGNATIENLMSYYQDLFIWCQDVVEISMRWK